MREQYYGSHSPSCPRTEMGQRELQSFPRGVLVLTAVPQVGLLLGPRA